jgi:hypothetical protein
MFHYSRPRPYVHILRLRASRPVRRAFAGGALILLGLGFLLRNQGLIGSNDLWLIAPALIGLSGLVRLVAAPGAVNLVRAVLRLAVAAYLVVVIEHIGGWTFAATWPVLLIGVGGSMLGYEWLVRGRSQEENW